MRPEEHLAKRLSKIFYLRLVSWEQRIMIKTQSGSLKSYLRKLICFVERVKKDRNKETLRL